MLPEPKKIEFSVMSLLRHDHEYMARPLQIEAKITLRYSVAVKEIHHADENI